MLFQLFQLHLHLLFWHKESASAAIERLRHVLELEQWPPELAALRQQALLHLKILQVRGRASLVLALALALA